MGSQNTMERKREMRSRKRRRVRKKEKQKKRELIDFWQFQCIVCKFMSSLLM
jgi:hypothetical protein